MTTGAPSHHARTNTSSGASAMSRNYPAGTAKQRFMEEVYNKETSIRLGWHLSPAGRQRAQQAGSSRRKEVCRKRIEDACPKPTPALLRVKDRADAPREFRRRTFRIDELPAISKQASGEENEPQAAKPELEPEMYPVDPAVRALLYDGFSHEGRGRGNYLRRRRRDDPDHRYRDPVTTSLYYGWTVSDLLPHPTKPRYGRTSIVNSTFYTRSGVSTLDMPLCD